MNLKKLSSVVISSLIFLSVQNCNAESATEPDDGESLDDFAYKLGKAWMNPESFSIEDKKIYGSVNFKYDFMAVEYIFLEDYHLYRVQIVEDAVPLNDCFFMPKYDDKEMDLYQIAFDENNKVVLKSVKDIGYFPEILKIVNDLFTKAQKDNPCLF